MHCMKIYLKLCLKSVSAKRIATSLWHHLHLKDLLSSSAPVHASFKCGVVAAKQAASPTSLIIPAITKKKCHRSFVHLLIAPWIPGWTPQPRVFVMNDPPPVSPTINEIIKRSRRGLYEVQFGLFELCTMADALLFLQYVQSWYQIQSVWSVWSWEGEKRENEMHLTPYF